MPSIRRCVHLVVAVTAALGPAAAAAQEAQVRVEVQDQDVVRVEVQGNGQAQVQVQVQVGPQVRQPAPTSRPADVQPTLTVSQDRPGAPAHFAFALPPETPGTLAGPPTVKADFGQTRIDEGSLAPTACRFTWDVAAVRREAPALRGAELKIDWQLTPKAPPDAPPAHYVTLALVRLSPEGALTISEVNTSPVLPPQVLRPVNLLNIAGGISQSTRSDRDVSLTLLKKAAEPTTSMTLTLKNGHRFTRQPEVKVTVGSLGERAKWNPNAAATAETVVWSPPKDLPKEAAAGTVTWTFTSKAPQMDEERAGRVTAKVSLSPAGVLTLTGLESQFKVVKPDPPAEEQEGGADK